MDNRASHEPRGRELDPATKKALEEIVEIIQEVDLMGRNDWELPALIALRNQVARGEFEGDLENAVRQAREIKASKMDG